MAKKKKISVRSRAARKGWETRRRKALEAEIARRVAERERRRRLLQLEAERQHKRRSLAARKAARTRKIRARAAAEKEATRLRKWRASYQEYLKFRVPKKERMVLEVPAQEELVCRDLFDAERENEEHFWSNIRFLIGNQVSNILARIPAEEGIVTVTFREIGRDEFSALQSGSVDSDEAEFSELGHIFSVEYETELDADVFWSSFFDHARAVLPKDKDGKSGGSLLVVRMRVCFDPGQVSSD